MKKLAIASAIFSVAALTGTAHAYQAEVGGSYTYNDPDNFDATHSFGVDVIFLLAQTIQGISAQFPIPCE